MVWLGLGGGCGTEAGVETRLKVIRRTHSSSWAVCLPFCSFAAYLTNPSSAKHFSCLTQRVDWGNWLPSPLTTLSHGLCSGCNVVILSALQVSIILRTMDRKGRVRLRKRINFRIHSDGYFTFYFLIHSDSLFYILCVGYIWWLLLVVKFPASSTKLEIRKGLVMKLSSAAASITVTNPFAAFSGKTCKSLIHRLTFIANLNQLREITYCKSKSSNRERFRSFSFLQSWDQYSKQWSIIFFHSFHIMWAMG